MKHNCIRGLWHGYAIAIYEEVFHLFQYRIDVSSKEIRYAKGYLTGRLNLHINYLGQVRKTHASIL